MPVDGHRFLDMAERAGFEDEDVTTAETGPELLDMGFDDVPDGTGGRFFEGQSDGLRGYLRVRMRRIVE